MNRDIKIIMLTCDKNIDRRILLQAESLRENGWEVLIITKNDAENFLVSQKEHVNPTNVTFIYKLYRHLQKNRLFNKHLLRMIKSVFCLLFGTPADFQRKIFWPLVSQKKADIYVAHDLPMLPTAYACAIKYKAKLIYDSHELFPEQEFTTIERWMWQSLEKKYIGKCDRVMTINHSIASELKNRYHINEVEVVNNAEKKSKLDHTNQILHHTFGLAPNDRILLYQGNLAPNRNLELLIQGLLEVHSSRIHLVYMGSGPYLSHLQALTTQYQLHNRVHFQPAVPQDQLLFYTASADIGVIPYLPICLNNKLCTPNKLYEYIAAGLPIIAHDLVEINKLIRDYHIGMVGNLTSPQSFATLVEDLLSEDEKYMELKNAVMVAREEINWEIESKKLIALYDGITRPC